MVRILVSSSGMRRGTELDICNASRKNFMARSVNLRRLLICDADAAARMSGSVLKERK